MKKHRWYKPTSFPLVPSELFPIRSKAVACCDRSPPPGQPLIWALTSNSNGHVNLGKSTNLDHWLYELYSESSFFLVIARESDRGGGLCLKSESFMHTRFVVWFDTFKIPNHNTRGGPDPEGYWISSGVYSCFYNRRQSNVQILAISRLQVTFDISFIQCA